MDASRRYLYTPVSITQADNECRLEGDKTHEIFHFLSKKVGGGHFLCGPHQAEKWGGGTRPPRPPPIYAREAIAILSSMYTELIPITLLQAVAPYLDISLAMFISLGSMSNCWRGPNCYVIFYGKEIVKKRAILSSWIL